MVRLTLLLSIVACLLFPFKLMAQSPEIALSAIPSADNTDSRRIPAIFLPSIS